MSVQRVYLASLFTSSIVREKYMQDVIDGKLFTLESYYNEYEASKGHVSKTFDANPKLKLFMDSGAHSLIHKAFERNITYRENGTVEIKPEVIETLPLHVKTLLHDCSGNDTNLAGFLRKSVSRHLIDFTYFDTKECLKFLDSYIEWVYKYKDQLYVYVNLDVIFNPEKTYDNQKYMESCGLKPLPVFHFGEDIKWLKLYMDTHDYIGIGGLGQDITKSKFIKYMGDPVFDTLSGSKERIKTHGFAVTSIELMNMYDWYSCDSTSWVKHAAYGTALVPVFDVEGNPDYTKNPRCLGTSFHRYKEGAKNGHYTDVYDEGTIRKIREYFEDKGIDWKKLDHCHYERCYANIQFYKDVMNHYNKVDTGERKKLRIQRRFI